MRGAMKRSNPPTMPRGKKITSSTSSGPKNRKRYCWLFCSTSLRISEIAVSTSVPSSGPAIVPMPPITRFRSCSKVTSRPLEPGSRLPWYMAKMPPAKPARNVETMNATSFVRGTLTPVARASSSLSAIATNVAPTSDRRTSVQTTIANASASSTR